MKKYIKWIAATSAVLFIVVCLAVVSAIQLLNSSFGQDYLTGKINTIIAGNIALSDLNFSPLKGSLDLTKVVLKDPNGIGVVGFDNLYVKINWLSILKKEIRIPKILLQRPWGRLYIAGDGRFNLLESVALQEKKKTPEDKPAASKGLPVNVVLDQLRIEDGDVAFDYPHKALSLRSAGIDIRAGGDFLARSANLKIELAALDLRAREMQLPSSSISLAVGLKNSRVDLKKLNLKIGRSNLDLSGYLMDIYGLSGMKLRVDSNVHLTEIAEIFQLDDTWLGDVALTADLTGEVRNPNADLNIGLEKGAIFKRAIDRLELAVNLSDRRLLIKNALIESAEGKIALTGQADLKAAFADGLLKPPTDLNAITFNIALDQIAPDLGPWVPEVPGLGGNLESHLNLSGKGTSLGGLSARLDLSAIGNSLTATGIRQPMQARINLGAEIDGQVFLLQTLDATIDGIRVAGSGSYDPKERRVSAKMNVDAKDLSQPLTLFGLPDAKGMLHLALDLAGTLDQPRLDLLLDSKDLGYGHISIGTLQLRADLSPDRVLHISSLKLANQGSTVNGRAKLRFAESWKAVDPEYKQSLQLDLNGIEVRDFYDQEIVRGRVGGEITIAGKLNNLEGNVKLNGHDLAAQTIRLGNLSTQIRLDGSRLQLEELHLQNRNSELKGSGRISIMGDTFGKISPNPEFQLVLTSNQILLEDFLENLKGRFTLDTRLDGTLKHPQGSVALHGKKIETGVQKIAAVDLSARIDHDRVDVAPLKIALTTDEAVTLTGWAKKDLSFGFDLKSIGINLSTVDALKELKGLQGVLHASISGHGTLKDPSIDGSLLLKEIKINEQTLDDFRLHLSLHDQLARAYGNLEFDLDAGYHLLKKDFFARLDFFQTQLNTYFRMAGQPDLNGVVTGKVKVGGNIEHPADTTADLDLEMLSLFLKKKRLLQSDRIKARMQGQHILIDDTHIDLLSSGNLSIKGSAHLNGPLDMSMTARLPISDAGNFSEALVESKGDVIVDLAATGSLPRPQINGEVTLAEIGIVIPSNSQRVEKLNGKIKIDPNLIQIEDVKGKLDTGSFGINGSIGHDFFKPSKMSLNVFADALPVEVPDTLSLLLNSRIQISGEGGDADAKGEIILLSGSYYKDVKIDLSILEGLGKRSRSVAPPAKPIELPFFKKIDLNIDVSHREPFLVENNMANMEIRPDLTVGGTLSQPVLSGRANVTEGTITFKKKTFTINKGVIDFVNPYKTEMDIDIESSAEIRDWTIILSVKGTPDNLELHLTSTPSLSDADILSLLVFGKTSEEFSNGKSQGKKSTNELLAGLIADTFSDELKGVAGIDILELETGAENGETVASDRVKVTVGKHLSDRMTFKVSMESENGETVSRYMPEYKLLEHILVSGFQDTKGTYGGDLVFRIEFR